jgi:hypothetical protein
MRVRDASVYSIPAHAHQTAVGREATGDHRCFHEIQLTTYRSLKSGQGSENLVGLLNEHATYRTVTSGVWRAVNNFFMASQSGVENVNDCTGRLRQEPGRPARLGQFHYEPPNEPNDGP